MIFQVVHTHTNEPCPGRSTEQTKQPANWWRTLKKTPEVKVLAGYVSPIDHTMYCQTTWRTAREEVRNDYT
jgi:hypothetical protein